MFASELIEKLVDQVNQHGDHPVIISNGTDRNVDEIEFSDDEVNPMFLISGGERQAED